MNIVLLEPQIPPNTLNIARTCVCTGSKLHLIKPLGFEIDEKKGGRAALDYWKYLDVSYYENFNHFLEVNKNPNIFMATTKAKKTYTDVLYNQDDFIMFGKEGTDERGSAGIPEEILLNYRETCIRIPMLSEHRSLNLSNSVAIILYEALRQNNFLNLSKEGELHRNKW